MYIRKYSLPADVLWGSFVTHSFLPPKKILPFVTQYHPALPYLKNVLMGKWHLIQIQPYLRDIFKEPPLISYSKGKSLKVTQVRTKL